VGLREAWRFSPGVSHRKLRWFVIGLWRLAKRLRWEISADDLVDVSVGRLEVLPYLARGTLWMRIDELDSSAKQSIARIRKIVHFKSYNRTAAEELMVFVIRAIDMNFGSVVKSETSRFIVHGHDIEFQDLPIEPVHSVNLLRFCAHPNQTNHLHSNLDKWCICAAQRLS
jgi:hypothetical protein